MLVGLQGSGKTTSAAKLSNYLSKKKGFYKKPLLVGLDVYRPAAIEQLEKLAKDLNIEFYSEKQTKDVKRILKDAMAYAKFNDNDLIILDTAGRLQTDAELMDELKYIKKEVRPTETIFVADAMSGQELINVAEEFNNQIKLTSAIITKLDSNAKGGAALSLAKKIGVPINFIGTGEKVSDFEQFHPDRMAGRILGLGDIQTLTEKASEFSNESDNERMMRKMLSGQFDLNDLMESMNQVKKMGSLTSIANMIPGAKINQKQSDAANKKMEYFQFLMDSMTDKEKKNPKLLKHPSRKSRIISGSGRTAQEYNILIRDFDKSQKQMKSMAKMIKSGKMPNMNNGGY
jgi:signal recognition particle subunit SRP54